MLSTRFRIFSLLMITLCIVVLVGCEPKSMQNAPNSIVLKDIVYADGKEESQFTLFLSENNTLVPYLVLTDDYNGTGKCLLLRKNVLDDKSIFNPNMRFSGYYEDSVVDKLLNQTFFNTLSPQIRSIIETSSITITCKESLFGQSDAVMQIERKVFLLSASEVGNRNSRTILSEGSTLKYFHNDHQRIAYFCNGEVTSWWLRTPNSWYDNVVCGIDTNGIIGSGGVGSFGEEGEYTSGIRPAFCLLPNLLIQPIENGYTLVETT